MQNEREIDALLSHGEAGSIVDRLLAMPRQTEGNRAPNEWDRAVASRFETHLARQMRALIDSADHQRHAA
jgi:hypothetical protein